jgi:hypothetical protein
MLSSLAKMGVLHLLPVRVRFHCARARLMTAKGKFDAAGLVADVRHLKPTEVDVCALSIAWV